MENDHEIFGLRGIFKEQMTDWTRLDGKRDHSITQIDNRADNDEMKTESDDFNCHSNQSIGTSDFRVHQS
jgi:hypothetical protein